MVESKSLKLGEILLEKGVINHDQIMEILSIQKESGQKFGEIVVDRGYASDEEVAESLAQIYRLPFIKLSELEIPADVYAVVHVDMLKKFHVVPVRKDEDTLTLATNDPLNVIALQEVQYSTGLQVHPALASLRDIKEKLAGLTSPTTAAAAGEDDKGQVAQLVESYLAKAIKERASDLHFEPMKKDMRVRFRIDGVLYERGEIPHDTALKLISRIKIFSGMDVADHRRPQDGRMSLEKFKDYDIRVSTIPNVNGENMVLRVLNKSVTRFTFDALGMEEEDEANIKNLAMRPYGMILLTGPTGAGKSTTLYAILNFLNEPTRHIITVEDPVEYQIEGINQTNINNRIGYNFATAIRHMLRHDPNVIMVGEIRDAETAETAIRAALTGHLVLSTLHTNTSAGAIMRLLEMNIEPFLIRSSMIGVVAQRLVRRLCSHCKKEYRISEAAEKFGDLIQSNKDITLASPVGCPKCHKTGYSGRIGLYETLIVNDEIRDLVLADPNEKSITDIAVSQGMKTLKRAGIEKAVQKITSLEEVIRTVFTGQD